MRRLVCAVVAGSVAVAGAISWALLASGRGRDPRAGTDLSYLAPGLSAERPLAVLVRGWLWEPDSRLHSGPLRAFPSNFGDEIAALVDGGARLVEYRWSRDPRDLARARSDFTADARAISALASSRGRCPSFIGHSAGAAMVYEAAARGVPMGFMGTLGLPVAARSKPPAVWRWANFYTSTHAEDVPGMLWGNSMPADVNLDLAVEHKQMWGSREAARIAAEGVAGAWRGCRPPHS